MLTPRQQEIAELVARDWSAKKIAVHLGVSTQTVKDHIMDAANRLPSDRRARNKLTLWVISPDELDDAA